MRSRIPTAPVRACSHPPWPSGPTRNAWAGSRSRTASSTGRRPPRGDRHAVARDRPQSLRQGARRRLPVLGGGDPARRRPHGLPPGDGLAAVADRRGSRSPGVAPLADRHQAGRRRPPDRPPAGRRRRYQAQAARQDRRRTPRHRDDDADRWSRSCGWCRTSRWSSPTTAAASASRTRSSPTPGTSTCAPATSAGRRGCR